MFSGTTMDSCGTTNVRNISFPLIIIEFIRRFVVYMSYLFNPMSLAASVIGDLPLNLTVIELTCDNVWGALNAMLVIGTSIIVLTSSAWWLLAFHSIEFKGPLVSLGSAALLIRIAFMFSIS